jgi:NADH dehydrogenase
MSRPPIIAPPTRLSGVTARRRARPDHRDVVLVVGGGFGGAYAARQLQHRRNRIRQVVLVNANNFLLFSPLLAEVASGTVEPRHAVVPLRDMLRRTTVLVGTVTKLDLDARTAHVATSGGEHRLVRFDAVLLAPGAEPVVVNVPGLERHAVGFKTITDAIWLRNHLLSQFEAAATCDDPQRRRELLTFTFVGGGYTGVEALGELQSLAHDALRRYPTIHPNDTRWVLVETQDRLLPGLDERLARYTHTVLTRRGVEIHLGTRVISCTNGVVRLSAHGCAPFRSGTIVWAAGQRPSSFAADNGLPVDRHGRIVVDEHLAVRGLRRTYAVGDATAVPTADGQLAPGTAQQALRQGRLAARNIVAELDQRKRSPYTYRDRGLAVTLGRHDGTAQIKCVPIRGLLAWWLGRSYHLALLPGIARKARVLADWTTGLLFSRDIAQLGEHHPVEPPRLAAGRADQQAAAS